jgi:5-methylcytosine-specific restriction protein A
VIIKRVKDVIEGKASIRSKRSPKWPEVRKKHLLLHPTCEVCGGNKQLEVHHKQPFHTNPELELDPNNLITLCEANKGGCCHHLHFGHLGNYKNINPNVEEDVKIWSEKLTKNQKKV